MHVSSHPHRTPRRAWPLLLAGGALGVLLSFSGTSCSSGAAEGPPVRGDEAPQVRSDTTEMALLAEVTRGDIVESRHFGHISVVWAEDGESFMSLGEADRMVLSRSALKPLQAFPTLVLARERGLEVTPEEMAVACASHRAEPFHLQAVNGLLAHAGATPDDLYCGPQMPNLASVADSMRAAGIEPGRIHNNCSGKHSTMLLLNHLLEAPKDQYADPNGAVQQHIQEGIQRLTGYDEPLPYGIDGCGAPNYGLPLDKLALGFARLANPEGLSQVEQETANAMRAAIYAHPEHLSSTGSFDSQLIRAGGGRLVVKAGAEGCYGIGVSNPALGIAIKFDDGNARAMAPVVLALLERLRVLTPDELAPLEEYRTLDVTNTRGEVVGEIRSALR